MPGRIYLRLRGKRAALASAGNRLLAYSAAKRGVLDEVLEQARNR